MLIPSKLWWHFHRHSQTPSTLASYPRASLNYYYTPLITSCCQPQFILSRVTITNNESTHCTANKRVESRATTSHCIYMRHSDLHSCGDNNKNAAQHIKQMFGGGGGGGILFFKQNLNANSFISLIFIILLLLPTDTNCNAITDQTRPDHPLTLPPILSS